MQCRMDGTLMLTKPTVCSWMRGVPWQRAEVFHRLVRREAYMVHRYGR